ncbi:MAG: YtxH domain-containing protein [Acidimicrobiales bacterium]|nr:YtxH domain-containing protein [Acidimicrobiales bacterium]
MWLLRLAFSPVKIVLFVARTMGYNRFLLFLLGVAVGLLFAPMTGNELRDRLREQVEARLDGLSEPPVVASGLDTGR